MKSLIAMQRRLVSGLMLMVMVCLVFSLMSPSGADDDFAEHKLVIQISTDDPKVHDLALSNIVNVQKHYGVDNVAIELVAYGPGLSLLTKNSAALQRITSLTLQEVTFTACGNTMDTIHENTGQRPELIDGVEMAQTGVARIIELQEQGYAYLRP